MSNCLFIAYPNGTLIQPTNRLVDVTPTEVVERYETNHFLTTELEAGFQLHPRSLQFGNQCLNAFDYLISRMEKTTKRYQKSNKFKYSK
jgi:hypothetical protein